MRLFDTLSRRRVNLAFADGVVRMYVCGITPYDTSHLGHARVGVVYDTLRRFLSWRELEVRYVQNITDIDDPLFERARRDGKDWRALGDRQTARYLAALARINVEKPGFYVKATAMIAEMLPGIATLIERGYAYEADGAVFYNVAAKPDFGAIFQAPYAEMLETANQRGNDPVDPRKRAPLDFVLWQPSKPDEPSWDSPWGAGRPGWHIECSTIATHFLGPQVDIHGGGTDLIFPHHAAEIAQAEPITEVEPFVRAWMHVGMVYLDGEKMSKSLGNMVFVDDLLTEYSPNAVRLAILKHAYRDRYDYAAPELVAAEEQSRAIAQALAATGGTGRVVEAAPHRERFTAALLDDFDTPSAIITVVDVAEAITLGVVVGRDVRPAQAILRELAGVVGLFVD